MAIYYVDFQLGLSASDRIFTYIAQMLLFENFSSSSSIA